MCSFLCCVALMAAQAQTPRTTNGRGERAPELELANAILNTAVMEAESASPDARAFIQLRVALSLDGDKQKQRRLLEDAFLASLEIPVGRYDTRGPLKTEIINATLSQGGTDALEEIMPRADDYSRPIIRDLLISSYAEHRNFDRAVVLLKGTPEQEIYPYAGAELLMARLPPDKADLRRTVFDHALANTSGNSRNIGLMAPMIKNFWRDLPKDEVLQLINTILQEARQEDACSARLLGQSPDTYGSCVQQFLPILRKLDPDKAEFLVQQKASGGPPQEKCDYNKSLHSQTTSAAENTAKLAPAPVRRYVERPKRMVFGCATMGTCRQSKIEEVLRAINSNLKLKQFERAKAGIGEGFALAAEEWQYDADPDDPNLWTRNIWPSTENWEAFAILASYISPDYALDQIKTIPDPAIQLMVRVVLAGYWLGRDPELRPPNIANDEGTGCECVAHYMYIPRHWGEKLP